MRIPYACLLGAIYFSRDNCVYISGSWGVYYIHIWRGLSRCSVQQHRAMRRPLSVKRATMRVPRLVFIADTHYFINNDRIWNYRSVQNFLNMHEKMNNEELQSRREFFKNAAKSALPMFAFAAFGQTLLTSCERDDDKGSSGCGKSCSGSCEGDCAGDCDDGCWTACISACVRWQY